MATRYPATPPTADPIVVQINKFFDKVVDCVNQRRLALLAEANDKNLEMMARLTQPAQREQELLTTKAEIERNIKDNELRELQERMLADIEVKLAEVRLPQLETSLAFRGECKHLQQLISGLGEIHEEEVAVSRYRQMRMVVRVGKEGKKPGELWSPSGVAIDETSNQIYITEGVTSNQFGFARVSVFSERGDFLSSFTHKSMLRPYGITINRNNLFVTDIARHGVLHFEITANIRFVGALVGKGSSEGKFHSPGQLAVSDNGDLFISDSLNDRIQILDEHLHFLRYITHYSLHWPQDVKLTANEVYVLSSSDASPCVHVFSHAGDKLRSFITRGSWWKQVNRAFFFCMDDDKNLIISDGGDHSIKVFSTNGTHIHTIKGFPWFLTSNFYDPKGIALTKQFKIVVISPYDAHQLQIFSIV